MYICNVSIETSAAQVEVCIFGSNRVKQFTNSLPCLPDQENQASATERKPLRNTSFCKNLRQLLNLLDLLDIAYVGSIVHAGNILLVKMIN